MNGMPGFDARVVDPADPGMIEAREGFDLAGGTAWPLGVLPAERERERLDRDEPPERVGLPRGTRRPRRRDRSRGSRGSVRTCRSRGCSSRSDPERGAHSDRAVARLGDEAGAVGRPRPGGGRRERAAPHGAEVRDPLATQSVSGQDRRGVELGAVGAPLGDVSDDVVEAERVGDEAPDRRGTGPSVATLRVVRSRPSLDLDEGAVREVLESGGSRRSRLPATTASSFRRAPRAPTGPRSGCTSPRRQSTSSQSSNETDSTGIAESRPVPVVPDALGCRVARVHAGRGAATAPASSRTWR